MILISSGELGVGTEIGWIQFTHDSSQKVELTGSRKTVERGDLKECTQLETIGLPAVTPGRGAAAMAIKPRATFSKKKGAQTLLLQCRKHD